MPNVLLLSNSTMPGTSFFTWPKPYVKEFLTAKVKEVLFLPFAAVTFSFEEYEEKVKAQFEEMGFQLRSLHNEKDKRAAVEKAQAFVVGGGNTFALLWRIYNYHIRVALQKKVLAGVPYVGWSAGSNLACPTIMTTNDMPIVHPPSFEALNLIPFQINPHYHNLKFENQGGETRGERIQEFLVLNPSSAVIGLPEGMLLERRENKLLLKGEGAAKLYRAGNNVSELQPGDLSHLLQEFAQGKALK